MTSPSARLNLAVAVVALMLAASAAPSEASSKLPSNFKRCNAADPNLNECLRVAVEDAFRKTKNGISSLGVLPVDPLKVDQIKIDQGQGSVHMNMNLKDISITGLADTRISNYSADLANGILRTESVTKSLRLDFHHVISGRILVLPIQGAGPGTIILNEVVCQHYLKSIPKKKKDGKTYWNMQEYKVKFYPKTISMDLKGLFSEGSNQNSQLSTTLNEFLNNNARLIFDEIGGGFEEAFGAVFKEITSRVFNKVPFNEIFIQPKEG